jgi:hypothetical protein
MIDYDLDLHRRIATTRVTGRLRFADLANHLHRLVRDRNFQANFDAMIVAMDGAAVPPPSSVNSLGPLLRAWSSRRHGARWAFVLPTPETQAFAIRALAEARLPDVQCRCFLSETDALDWLALPRAAGRMAGPSPVSLRT